MKKSARIAVYILLSIVLVAASILFFSSMWLCSMWQELSMDEIIYHIKAPLEGASRDMVVEYVLKYGIVEFVLPALLIVLMVWSGKPGRGLHRWHGLLVAAMAVLSVLGLAATGIRLENRLSLITYLRDQRVDSTFIEDHYIAPETVELTFPEEKRNLIYIYLESMEITYADKENGGAFDENYIPELTRLAQENENFSGADTALDGAYSLSGTTWTMGGMLAQTSGLPLKVGLRKNDMSSQESFYPSISALGDILADEGYTNELLIGSKAEFGGRKLYFSQHGDYEFFDYTYALENGYLPSGYHVWWGYEDEKLFEYAKEGLTELAAAEEPFNFTMLTVDTHFEDGYVCRLCEDEFDGDQYANVLACSSRQVSGFISWIQEQDFYGDTTVILMGDHPTADSDFCADIGEYPRRVYTCVINGAPAVAAEDAWDGMTARTFDTFDLFPTTLASLGVKIEGNRLGLGVNLYSGESTLVEEYGLKECGSKLSQKSAFMEELGAIHLTDSLISTFPKYATLAFTKNGDRSLTARVNSKYNFHDLPEFQSIVVEYWDATAETPKHKTLKLKYDADKGCYTTKKKIRDVELEDMAALARVSFREAENIWLDSYCGALAIPDVCDYLETLSGLVENPDYAVFITVRDEASQNLPERAVSMMKALGLDTDLRGHYQGSYCAVIETGADGRLTVWEEQADAAAVSRVGALSDGTDYELLSAGYHVGKTASIILHGEERAPDARGLNIAVYSKSLGDVVDVAAFDTHEETFSTVLTNYLAGLNDPDYAVFFSIKDEGTDALTGEIAAQMKALGLGKDLRGHYRTSYAAVVETNAAGEKMVQEQMSDAASVSLKGSLTDGTAYEVKSAGHDAGNESSIVLGGEEYSPNRRGLNIVVYSKSRQEVIESVTYDTYKGTYE